MKIVQVVRRIHPNGGASGVAYFLKAEFDKLGIENDVITQGSVDKRPRSLGLDRLRTLIDVVSFSVSATRKVSKIKDRNVVTIVHNDALGGDIYVDHGLHRADVARDPSMLLRNPIHLFLLGREALRHRLSQYHKLVALSDFSFSQIRKYYPGVDSQKIERIPNGVDVAKFDLPRESTEADSLRLIFVGHAFARKGLSHVIESLSLLPETVTLTVVGGSSGEIDKFSVLAKSRGVAARVTFLGRRTDVPQLLSRHDVMVFPSGFESWQLVVLEAMAAGLPVLGTPVGCAPEVIQDGKNGYLIQPSAPDIAEKITLILANQDTLATMRVCAKQTATRYSWSSIALRYRDLAQQVLRNRSVLKSG
ncbi:MAG TPA: glycosyltransferase family 4 protein [Paraburkholderia sp.]